MTFTHWWTLHTHAQALHGRKGGSFDPAAIFGACLCLLVLACWAAYQMQSRCAQCGAWPVRCHCDSRVRARR